MKKIVVVGGAGFVGQALVSALSRAGYSVLVVDRVRPAQAHAPTAQVSYLTLDLMHEQFPPGTFFGSYGVINLAGAPIAHRWNREYQDLILKSRTVTTTRIVEAITATPAGDRPVVLVSASAVGFYGDGKDELLAESHKPGADFLARVCVAWEAVARAAERADVRVVLMRTAHVLGRGGILSELAPLFKKGIGGYFGSGRQYMPWVHIDDLVAQYMYALEHPLRGPYNTAAGVPVTQKEFMKTVARALGAPLCWHIPRWAAMLAKGSMASIFFGGQKIDSSKIAREGFTFTHTALLAALRAIFDK